MRALSDFEKHLIDKMIEIGAKPQALNNLMNLLDEYLEGVRIAVNKKDNTAEILFSLERPPTEPEQLRIIERVNPLTSQIVSAVNLIKNLEAEGYLLLYKRAEFQENEIRFGRGAQDRYAWSFKLTDTAIVELLIEYIQLEILVTEALTQYVKAGYLTDEERRHRQNLRWTRIGLLIALLIGILPSYLPMDDSKKMNDEQFKIIQTEFDSLNKNLHSIGARLNSLSAKDTINARIVSPTPGVPNRTLPKMPR